MMKRYQNKFIKIIEMLFWSTVRNYSFRTWTIIVALSTIILSSALFYLALSYSSSNHNSIFSQVKRPSVNLKSKYKDYVLQDTYQEFKRDLLFAHLPQNNFNILENHKPTKSGNTEILTNFLNRIYPVDLLTEDIDELAYDLKYLLIDFGLESKMTCKEIDSLFISGIVVKSHSKYIEYANLDNYLYEFKKKTGKTGSELVEFIVKSTNMDSNALEQCMMKSFDVDECTAKKNYGLLREVLLYSALQHPNIILMKGYCLRGSRLSKSLRNKGLVVVTEVGIPFSLSLFRSCTWPQKISMALQIARLLLYLENSPFGSLRFNKLALSDFVLVRGTIAKLAELDGLELGDLPCTDHFHCDLSGLRKENFCVNGFCEAQNPNITLHLVTEKVLKLLLMEPPTGYDETSLVSRVESFNFTSKELVDVLQYMFDKHPPEGPVHFVQPIQTYTTDKNSYPRGEYDIKYGLQSWTRHSPLQNY